MTVLHIVGGVKIVTMVVNGAGGNSKSKLVKKYAILIKQVNKKQKQKMTHVQQKISFFRMKSHINVQYIFSYIRMHARYHMYIKLKN